MRTIFLTANGWRSSIAEDKKKDEIAVIDITEEYLKERIYEIRGQRVILDADLSEIYGYTTKAFNQQVKNNIEKFDEDFMFELTDDEVENLRSNFLTANLNSKSRYNNLPNQLSGGQQQRVAIARALVNRPEIIFADEPTGNLDSKTSDEVIALLKMTAKKYGQTIVMITHDDEIAQVADRILVIEDGQVVDFR